jgi:hypothetical protein
MFGWIHGWRSIETTSLFSWISCFLYWSMAWNVSFLSKYSRFRIEIQLLFLEIFFHNSSFVQYVRVLSTKIISDIASLNTRTRSCCTNKMTRFKNQKFYVDRTRETIKFSFKTRYLKFVSSSKNEFSWSVKSTVFSKYNLIFCCLNSVFKDNSFRKEKQLLCSTP